MQTALYIILGIVLAIVALVLTAVIHTLMIPKKTASYRYSDDKARIDEYADKLAKMIRYETVSVRGEDQTEKFRGFHKIIGALFPKVFETCTVNEIDGNLMVCWKGSNPELDPVVLMSHQDVVPAEGEWKYPPFSGHIADGKIWGRGSADTKCSVMAFYQAAEELITAGYQPACDVYLVSGCTEEVGGSGGPKMCKWFKDNGIHLFMLCDEGGSVVLDPIGGVKGAFAAVGIFEKGYGDVKFIARSNGGHASAPGRNTPIPRLARFIAAVERKSPFKAQFSPAVEAMFSGLAPYCSSFGLKLIMANLWLFKPLVRKLLPAISPQAAAMLQTTIAFTMQEGSNGYNVLPQEASVSANMRFIPHQGTDESLDIITKMADGYGLETEVVYRGYPSKSLDLNGKPFEMTGKAINKIFPGVGMMPYVVTGATDARFYGDVCDACVRFSPVLYGPEQMEGMHGLNENLEIATLPGAVDYYKEIIRLQEERSV